MREGERPTQDLIRRVSQAVTFRNQIMHALRNKPGGTYLIRQRTNAELSAAFSAAIELYDFYRKAFERLLLKANEKSTT